MLAHPAGHGVRLGGWRNTSSGEVGCDVEVAGDVAGRPRVISDQGEDGAAVRFGERFERVRIYGWRPRKATSRSVTGGGPGPGGGAIKGRRRASYLGVKCREQ